MIVLLLILFWFFCLLQMRMWKPLMVLKPFPKQFCEQLKILSSRTMSQQQSEDVVLTEVKNNKGILTLNRPKALNSLNMPMVCAITCKLLEWENLLDCVIVKGAGGKAFCAGGDVVAVTSGCPTNCTDGVNFFRCEYSMDSIIGHYKIPYIAIIDGITMGGGVGLSVHGSYRIATERTLFAMPETAIGLFPDVGGSFFLPRLGGNLGLYLALTGQRLKGKDVVKVGVATHFVECQNIPKLIDALVKADPKECCFVDEVLKKFAVNVKSHTFSLASNLAKIDQCFSAPTVEEIFERLKADGSSFARDTLQLLQKMSPISLKITKVQLEKGKLLDLKECLQMEFRLATAALEARSSPDFYEG